MPLRQVFAAKALNSTESVRPFLRTLLRLTDFLVENGLYPATQLTTDDFLGAHTNNTNLAVKSIVGNNQNIVSLTFPRNRDSDKNAV